MIIICLEGCHGCGKTSLCWEFENRGLQVLDEAFLDMPEYSLHPQSLLMETMWVCSWFDRVLNLAHKFKDLKQQPILIADRSPFSAVFYANHGKLLEPVIREQMKEVQDKAKVEIITVHVTVDREVLWERIQERLIEEPSRVKYNEHKREWMEQTLDFYDNFNWDLTVSNDLLVDRTVENIFDALSIRDDSLKDVLHNKLNSSFHTTDSESELESVLSESP